MKKIVYMGMGDQDMEVIGETDNDLNVGDVIPYSPAENVHAKLIITFIAYTKETTNYYVQ